MKKNKKVIIFTLIALMLMSVIIQSYAIQFENCHTSQQLEIDNEIYQVLYGEGERFDDGISYGYLHFAETHSDQWLIGEATAFPLAINGIFEGVVNTENGIFYIYPLIYNGDETPSITLFVCSERAINNYIDEQSIIYYFLLDNTIVFSSETLRLALGFLWINEQDVFDPLIGRLMLINILDTYNIDINQYYEGDGFEVAYISNPTTLCNVTRKEVTESMAIITAILAIFTAIGNWFVEIIPDVLGIFWDAAANSGEGALTILGALAVASLAIAVILLVFRWITNFFKFRG